MGKQSPRGPESSVSPVLGVLGGPEVGLSWKVGAWTAVTASSMLPTLRHACQNLGLMSSHYERSRGQKPPLTHPPNISPFSCAYLTECNKYFYSFSGRKLYPSFGLRNEGVSFQSFFLSIFNMFKNNRKPLCILFSFLSNII